MDQKDAQAMSQQPHSPDASAVPSTHPKPFRFATGEFTPRSAKQFDEAVSTLRRWVTPSS
jgi:hypothetical protein